MYRVTANDHKAVYCQLPFVLSLRRKPAPAAAANSSSSSEGGPAAAVAAAASPFPEFVSSLVVERAAAVDSGKYGCDSEAGESGLTDVHVITGPLLF